MEETKFHPRGKKSIAGFLKAIKENPNRRGVAFIAELVDMHYMDVEVALNELKEKSLVKNESYGSKQPRYVVTTQGHRYLEAHKEDLTQTMPQASPETKAILEAMDDEPIVAAPKTSGGTALPGYGIEHTVPDSPAPQLPENWIPSKQKPAVNAPIVNTPKKTIVLPAALPAPKKEGEHVLNLPSSMDEKAGDDSLKEETLVPIAPVTNAMFRRKFKSVLSEILYERYAENVSAKDVLEKLEKLPEGEVDSSW